MGDKALCVCSGQLALDYLQLRFPSLVILEVMRPDMDGIEVSRRIRGEPKTAHLPVIMFSAIDDPGYADLTLFPLFPDDLSDLRQQNANVHGFGKMCTISSIHTVLNVRILPVAAHHDSRQF